MEKTEYVSLGGYSFCLETPAFKRLSNYLDDLRNKLDNHAEAKEIYQTIEERLAELLGEQIGRMDAVVTLEIVERVLLMIGDPEDMMGDGANEPERDSSSQWRFYRDTKHAILGGVCASLALKLNIPSWALRVIFLASCFWHGIGALIYLVLWVSVPAARTPIEKLRMRGGTINLDSIKAQVRASYDNAVSNLGDPNLQWPKVKHGLYMVVMALCTVLLGLLKVLPIALGVTLILGLSITIMILTVGLLMSIAYGFDNIVLNYGDMLTPWLLDALEGMPSYLSTIYAVLIYFIVVIPLGLIMVGCVPLLSRRPVHWGVALIGGIVWVAMVCILVLMFFYQRIYIF